MPQITSPDSWREWRKGRLSGVNSTSPTDCMSVKDSFIMAMTVGSSSDWPRSEGSSSSASSSPSSWTREAE